MAVQTPNMNLLQPTIGVDSGLSWEQAINANSQLVDQHNHTPGYGVFITPAGLNINTALSFQNNAASDLLASIYTPQSSLSTLLAAYVIGNDLYFNDGNGNIVRLTAGGAVNATSSGISSGSATAGFSGGVLIVNAASNTPANIQAGSILLGNNVSGSKFLTLAPPAAMAANFSLTLPSLPVATSFMTLDNSGNMAGSIPIVAGITGSNIAAATIAGSNIGLATITGSNIANNTIPQSKLQASAPQVSSSCGGFTTSSTSYVPVTNLSVTITTSGGAVAVGLQADGSGVGSISINNSGVPGNFQIVRGSTSIAQYDVEGTGAPHVPSSSANTVDVVAAGTYTYTFQAKTTAAGIALVSNSVLVAYEI